MHGVVCVLAAFICYANAGTVTARISTSDVWFAGSGELEVRAYTKSGGKCLLASRSFVQGEVRELDKTCPFGSADVWRIEVTALTTNGWRAEAIEVRSGSSWVLCWSDSSQKSQSWVDASYAALTVVNWYKPERVTVLFYSGMSESPTTKHTTTHRFVRLFGLPRDGSDVRRVRGEPSGDVLPEGGRTDEGRTGCGGIEHMCVSCVGRAWCDSEGVVSSGVGCAEGGAACGVDVGAAVCGGNDGSVLGGHRRAGHTLCTVSVLGARTAQGVSAARHDVSLRCLPLHNGLWCWGRDCGKYCGGGDGHCWCGVHVDANRPFCAGRCDCGGKHVSCGDGGHCVPDADCTRCGQVGSCVCGGVRDEDTFGCDCTPLDAMGCT